MTMNGKSVIIHTRFVDEYQCFGNLRFVTEKGKTETVQKLFLMMMAFQRSGLCRKLLELDHMPKVGVLVQKTY